MAMEKRLIDADALLQQIEKRLQKYDGEQSDYIGGRCSGLDMAREMVDNADAVDAVEVVQGRWEEYPDEYGICATEFTCSNCRESFCTSEMADTDFLEMMKYCPNCGTMMIKERGAGE